MKLISIFNAVFSGDFAQAGCDHVQIESRDALKLILEMDSPDTLFYLDPPYLFETRTTKTAYSHEMTNADHLAFAETLYQVRGPVVLSGYPSEIYEELFEKRGWKRMEKEALTNGNVERTECLWLSPNASALLTG